MEGKFVQYQLNKTRHAITAGALIKEALGHKEQKRIVMWAIVSILNRRNLRTKIMKVVRGVKYVQTRIIDFKNKREQQKVKLL